jgi:hypothetical protein
VRGAIKSTDNGRYHALSSRVPHAVGCWTIELLHDNHTKQGKHMLDTIELLEAIGQDASLRHASAEELTNMLEQAQASVTLKAAAASGDSSRLSEELGHKAMFTPQISQAFFGEL